MIRNLIADFLTISTTVTFSVALILVTAIVIISSLYDQNYIIYAQPDRSGFLSGSQINVSNNTEGDSVYAQVAASGNNVYVVWQDTEGSDTPPRDNSSPSVFDSLYSQNKNYDIYFRKSVDGGITFGEDINLSNSPGFSEHPQIAAIGNNVYIVWVDDTYGNKEISFIRSNDTGSTFDQPTKISNNTLGDSQDVEIAAFGDALYIVWEDTTSSNSDSNNYGIDNTDTNIQKNRILLRASENNGDTFKDIKLINGNMDRPDSRPKVAASGENLYVTWNIGTPEDKTAGSNDSGLGVFVVKGSDKGERFSKPYKLNENDQSVGETQVASSGNNSYVVWAGDPDKRIESNMFFSKSINSGNTFEQAAIIIQSMNNSTNPVVTAEDGTSLNAEIAAHGNDIYIPWQNKANEADRNEEILLIRSTDKGSTFNASFVANLSNNSGISECPSIAISGNDIYVVWEDDTTGNHEILFKRLIPVLYENGKD
jgi:hypothetical protein